MILFDLLWATATAAPTPLADEAVSAVGTYTASRNHRHAHLLDLEKRLLAEARRNLDALAYVKAERHREEAADPSLVAKSPESEPAEAIEGIDLDPSECIPIAAKRKRKLTEITSEAA